MALELFAAVAMGFGAAGIAMLLRRIAPALVPRFLIPVAAGGAMIGFTIWSEYAWFSRQSEGLPAGFEVASTHAAPSAFRPWTYLLPYVSRFAAVDVGAARRHEGAPGRVIAKVYLFERYAPTTSLPVLFDCPGARRAALTDGANFAEDGAVLGVDWSAAGPEDPLLSVVCAQ